MPPIKKLTKVTDFVRTQQSQWYPGHMMAGRHAIIGKLNTVDCVVEVHDARIPLTGRNREFRKHLGMVKPHLLVLNKSDLADLSNWNRIERKLYEQGDQNVLLTDLTGGEFSYNNRGYNKLLPRLLDLITNSDRYNRSSERNMKIMVVGIPNVGKSTLISRLRNHYLGTKGKASRIGPEAGVTRAVENIIKICARPPIYSFDTPGVLQPGVTKDKDRASRLALCAAINDRVLNPRDMAEYLYNHLNKTNPNAFKFYDLSEPRENLQDFISTLHSKIAQDSPLESDQICWRFIRDFRKGKLGRVMFD